MTTQTHSYTLYDARATLAQYVAWNTKDSYRPSVGVRLQTIIGNLHPIERLTLRDECADMLEECRRDQRVGVINPHDIVSLRLTMSMFDR